MNRTAWLVAFLLAAPAPHAYSDQAGGEAEIVLKDSPGRQLVEANCVMCHSLDYIVMHSVFLDRKGWEGSVNKMVKVMGAPIAEQDTAAIIEYLARNYGK